MSHTSHEITVGRGDTSLSLRQDTHISAKAGSAGRCTYHCSRFDEGLKKSLFHCLHVDGLGGGDHDTAHSLCHMSACKYLRCGAQIVDTSVGTGSDHYLINGDRLHLVNLIDGMCILRQMRECHGRP